MKFLELPLEKGYLPEAVIFLDKKFLNLVYWFFGLVKEVKAFG